MKELEVTEEMAEMVDESIACKACRDKAITALFGTKRAIYYGKRAVKMERSFWNLANKLYPETKEGTWAYRNGKVFKLPATPPGDE